MAVGIPAANAQTGSIVGRGPIPRPAHHWLVGHPQLANRPAPRRAGRPDAQPARRRAARAGDHTRAGCVRRAPRDPVTPLGPVRLADPAFAIRCWSTCTPCFLSEARRFRRPVTWCGRGPRYSSGPRTGPLGRHLPRWCADRWGPDPSVGRHRRYAARPPAEAATAQAMMVIAEFAPDAGPEPRRSSHRRRELYRGSDPPWVAPLRPDLLAGQLLRRGAAQRSDPRRVRECWQNSSSSSCSPNSPG